MAFYTNSFHNIINDVNNRYTDMCLSIYWFLEEIDNETDGGGNVFTTSLLGELFGHSHATNHDGETLDGHRNWGHFSMLEHLVSQQLLCKRPLYSSNPNATHKKPLCNLYYIKYNFHKIDRCVTNNQLRKLKDDSMILLRNTFETK